MKIYKILVVILSLTVQGCQKDSFDTFANNLNKNTNQLIESTLNYNYKEFFTTLKVSYKTAKRNRTTETQDILMETQRDKQNYAYNGIIKECEILSCFISESELNRNTLFPQNTTGKFIIEIPISKSAAFMTAISKYGKITKNTISIDSYIEKDLVYYNNELNNLKLIEKRLTDNLNRPDVFNATIIQEIEEELSKINIRIMYINSDIKYLNEKQDIRKIEITINRTHNSTSNKVKTKLQNAIYYASDFLHLFIIGVFLFMVYYIFKITKYLLKTFITFIRESKRQNRINTLARNNEKQTIIQQQYKDPKLPPM